MVDNFNDEGINEYDLNGFKYLVIDLSKERQKVDINKYGVFSVLAVQQVEGFAYIQINSEDAQPMPLHEIEKINAPIRDVYITNSSYSGSAIIALGDENSNIDFVNFNKDVDNNIGVKQADFVTTLPAEQWATNLGKTYVATDKITISAGATEYVQFKSYYGINGDFKVQLRPPIINSNTGDVDIEFYEDPDITTDGTTEPNISIKARQLPDDREVEIYTDPTVNTDGTLLKDYSILAGLGQIAQSEFFSPDIPEFNLKHNTDYLFKITNNNASQITVYFEFNWLEGETEFISLSGGF